MTFAWILCSAATAVDARQPPRSGDADDAAPSELARSDYIAIRAAIENQLSAFRRDDGAAAFSFAAPSVQAKFGSPESFMRMVRESYPAVYRAKEVKFQALAMLEGEPTQQALLVGVDGVPVMAFYVMEHQGDGVWKIKGCVVVTAQREST